MVPGFIEGWMSMKRILLASLLVIPTLISCSPDCVWDGKGQAWIDTNENGQWDNRESPMPGVHFFVTATDGTRDSEAVSNWKGEASLHVWLPGCPRLDFEVHVENPEGYRLTTSPRLAENDAGIYPFGFTYLPGAPTATPRPPSPQCTSCTDEAYLGYPVVLDIAIASDNTVWFATYGGGASQYNPLQDTWTIYTTADGLISNQVRTIAVAPDGALWFSTEAGATRFDGSSWASYTTQDGLVSNRVRAIAFALDGTIWFGTFEGASHFVPIEGIWATLAIEDGLPDDSVKAIAVTPDGSIWFATLLGGVAQLVPAKGTGEELHWTIHSWHQMGISDVEDIVLGTDKTLWFAGHGGIAHFTDAGWKGYTAENTGDPSVPDTAQAIAVAADGSLWIATRYSGVVHFIPSKDATDEDTWVIYNTEDGLVSDEVTSVAVTPDGVLWFGAYGGISRCEISRQKPSSLEIRS